MLSNVVLFVEITLYWDECKDANNLETSAHDKEIYGSFMEKIEI